MVWFSSQDCSTDLEAAVTAVAGAGGGGVSPLLVDDFPKMRQ